MKLKKYKLLVLGLILAMAILLFANLGNRVMFVEESITAMLGRNILEFGLPKVWGGKNIVMWATDGSDVNTDLVFIGKSWLSFYLAAFGQLLGKHPVYMRGVFVFIGLIGAVLFYFLTKGLTKSIRIALIALTIYVFSVPLYLYIRSISYISLALTFSILAFVLYIKYIKTVKTRDLVGLVLALILLFHSAQLFFFATMITLITTYLIFDKSKQNRLEIILGSVTTIVFTLPWAIYANSSLNSQTTLFKGLEDFPQRLLGYMWQIQGYFIPFISLLLIMLFFYIVEKVHKKKTAEIDDGIICDHAYFKPKTVNKRKKEKVRNKYLIISHIIFNILIISLFQNSLYTSWLIPSIPFCFIIAAYSINYLMKRERFIGMTVLALILCTNILHIGPYLMVKSTGANLEIVEAVVKPPVPFKDLSGRYTLQGYMKNLCYPRSYFLDYLMEISGDYDDANEGMIKFLEKYGQIDDTVYLVGYQHETVAYYTNLRVVKRPVARFRMTDYPLEKTDWIIDRSGKLPTAYDKEPIWYNEDLFEPIFIEYPEKSSWSEIWAHTFWNHSPSGQTSGFYIYRNRLTTREIEDGTHITKNILERNIY